MENSLNVKCKCGKVLVVVVATEVAYIQQYLLEYMYVCILPANISLKRFSSEFAFENEQLKLSPGISVDFLACINAWVYIISENIR